MCKISELVHPEPETIPKLPPFKTLLEFSSDAFPVRDFSNPLSKMHVPMVPCPPFFIHANPNQSNYNNIGQGAT